jgi:hypothetical protein
MAEADREKLIDRIKKLRAKGSDSAVTEEEANAFLDTVARLMAEHAISDEDLHLYGIEVEIIPKAGVHVDVNKQHPAALALGAIAHLTGTAIGSSVCSNAAGSKVSALVISGRKPDREVADFLFDQVRNLIDAAWKEERRRRLAALQSVLRKPEWEGVSLRECLRVPGASDRFGVDKKNRRSFGIGMAINFSNRIEAMAVRKQQSDDASKVWNREVKATYDDTKDMAKLKASLDARSVLAGQSQAGKIELELGAGIRAGSGQQKLEKL